MYLIISLRLFSKCAAKIQNCFLYWCVSGFNLSFFYIKGLGLERISLKHLEIWLGMMS